MIYAFTQWFAALALVVANAEMRFLWLTLATAVLVAALILTRRSLQHEPDQQTKDHQGAA
jgi:bacteriorhodopsin